MSDDALIRKPYQDDHCLKCRLPSEAHMCHANEKSADIERVMVILTFILETECRQQKFSRYGQLHTRQGPSYQYIDRHICHYNKITGV